MGSNPVRVLFVCMGNICRSPAGESIFRQFVEQERLGGVISCESAGTYAGHEGEKADPRMIRAASRRGYRLSGRARAFVPGDFDRFDLIVSMDQHVLGVLRAMARTPEHESRLTLMGDFHPNNDTIDIPDPYAGPLQGFEHVLDLLEVACRRLLDQIKSRHGLPPA
jgi:protein-tyrosine phosphatase